MDNWYNKQFTTNPDKNDETLNATALAVLLLRAAPRYWHGHPRLEELEAWDTVGLQCKAGGTSTRKRTTR